MVSTFPFHGVVGKIKHHEKNLYLYEVEKNKKIFCRGLVCLVDLKGIDDGSILCHEEIFASQSDYLLNSFSVSHKQINPVLLITDDNAFKTKVLEASSNATLIEKCIHTDGCTHSLFKLDNAQQISIAGPLCIADGHHRVASLSKYYQLRNHPFPAIMAAIFNADEISTRSKAIVVEKKGLPSISFIEKVEEYFEVKSIRHPEAPENAYEFNMLFSNAWYNLSLKSSFPRFNELQDLLGIEILKKLILQNVMNLPGYANTPSVKVFFDSCNINVLKQNVRTADQMGFLASSDKSIQVIQIAKNGRLLEANSTYFEPKLINGMIGHEL